MNFLIHYSKQKDTELRKLNCHLKKIPTSYFRRKGKPYLCWLILTANTIDFIQSV